MHIKNDWSQPIEILWPLGIIPQAVGLTTMWGELTEKGRAFARTHFPRALDTANAIACHRAVVRLAPLITVAGRTHHELPHHEYLTLLGEEILRRHVVNPVDLGRTALAHKRLTLMDALCIAAAAMKTTAHEAGALHDCANSVLFRDPACACIRCRS